MKSSSTSQPGAKVAEKRKARRAETLLQPMAFGGAASAMGGASSAMRAVSSFSQGDEKSQKQDDDVAKVKPAPVSASICAGDAPKTSAMNSAVAARSVAAVRRRRQMAGGMV